MRYRTWFVAPTLAALSAAVLACGSSSTGPAPSQLVGTWTATKVEFVSVADPTQKVDIVAQGATVTMQIEANNTFTYTVQVAGQPDEVTTGTWTASGDVFTVSPAGVWYNQQFQMSLAGSTLTLAGADAEYDVNNDGTDEAVKLSMVLTQ